jgi:23S rRNA (cytosine1962-C5)-methyltransferase
LLAASAWRDQIVADAESYRVVHAEGDLLPGLIIDRYRDVFVLQTLTRGMDRLKQMWVEMLVETFQPRLIVERNDVKVRSLEGLPLLSGILHAAEGQDVNAIQLEVLENGLKFTVDPLHGQKTGAFLDQRENRAAAMRYARGRGLDCFTFHGSFALHLARGCDQVTAIDISAPAIERARRTAELNALTNVTFIEGNVFDEIHRLDNDGQKFETIVLDPPAFAKNRRAIDAALRGYKEINLRALKLLSPGGVLITCSCSYHISEEMFLAMIVEAARDAHREVQIVERRTQSRDHPILLAVPQTGYLKCLILRVI